MNKIIYAGRLLVIVLALALVALSGCSKNEETKNNETASGENVKKAASQITREQINAFWEQMEKKLTDYGDKIDLLQEKTETLSGDARAKAEQDLQAMRDKYDAVDDKLNGLKDSGSDTWAQYESSTSAAMEDLGNAYKKAAGNFSEPPQQ